MPGIRMNAFIASALLLATGSGVNGLEFEIPSSAPANSSGQLDAAPVGVSYVELFYCMRSDF